MQSQFGGQIFGFDIDQNGTEGVLSEAQTLNAQGKILSAVETFDQATGAILSVVKKLESHDDFLTLGIVGSSVGLVEHEHEKSGQIYVTKRIYEELSPVSANKFTGTWKSGLVTEDLIMGVSRNQGAGGNVHERDFVFREQRQLQHAGVRDELQYEEVGAACDLDRSDIFFQQRAGGWI